jgi:hypothetical protein
MSAFCPSFIGWAFFTPQTCKNFIKNCEGCHIPFPFFENRRVGGMFKMNLYKFLHIQNLLYDFGLEKN